MPFFLCQWMNERTFWQQPLCGLPLVDWVLKADKLRMVFHCPDDMWLTLPIVEFRFRNYELCVQLSSSSWMPDVHSSNECVLWSDSRKPKPIAQNWTIVENMMIMHTIGTFKGHVNCMKAKCISLTSKKTISFVTFNLRQISTNSNRKWNIQDRCTPI